MTNTAHQPIKLFQFPAHVRHSEPQPVLLQARACCASHRSPMRSSTRPIPARDRRAAMPSSKMTACESPIHRASSITS